MNDVNSMTVEQIYEKVRPNDLDEDVAIMVLDWDFSLGLPRINSLWVLDGGAYYPITGSDCVLCLLKSVFELSFENDQALEIDQSVRFFLLAIINHKNDGEFPDEYFFYNSAKLIDVVLSDSGHDKGGEFNG